MNPCRKPSELEHHKHPQTEHEPPREPIGTHGGQNIAKTLSFHVFVQHFRISAIPGFAQNIVSRLVTERTGAHMPSNTRRLRTCARLFEGCDGEPSHRPENVHEHSATASARAREVWYGPGEQEQKTRWSKNCFRAMRSCKKEPPRLGNARKHQNFMRFRIYRN